MEILKEYQFLLFAIGLFLVIVIILPFIFKEIKGRAEAKNLINRIVPAASITGTELGKIKTLHSEGKKLYPVIIKSICVGCGTCVISCQEKEALYLINSKSTLVNPYACRSRGDCEQQCPTGALRLVEYGQKVRIEVPEVDENFQSNRAGIYLIGAVNGAGLIKEAINQGRAAVNHIMKDVFPDNLPQILIIGAGPAGISALLSCRKFGLSGLCFEKDAVANTIVNFPKKKILMAEPVEMPLYGPLWVGNTVREELLEVWDRILKKTGAKIITDSRLEEISGTNNNFRVRLSGKVYSAAKIILAIGNRGVPRKLNVPGEDGPNVFYNLLDAGDFARRSIVIVGAGDSAVEAALSLVQEECSIRMVVRGDSFPRVKEKNQKKIAEAIKNKNITVFFNSQVEKIGYDSITVATPAEKLFLKNEIVFIMAGGELPTTLLEKIGINIVEKEI